jgi:hypothetical protein
MPTFEPLENRLRQNPAAGQPQRNEGWTVRWSELLGSAPLFNVFEFDASARTEACASLLNAL